MINNKGIIFFLIFFLTNHCSFDDKTGIWGDAKKEARRISELEQQQKKIIEIEKVYSTETIYKKEKILSKNITLSKAKKNSSWTMSGMNHQNLLGNIYLSGIDNVFLKKKIGKDKFETQRFMSPLLAYNNNLIFSDDKGTIFNVNEFGKINWKKNIYKKIYKRIYKNLVFSIYNNNIYIADNIGFIYAIDLDNGKLSWIKNYGIPVKSNIKIFKDKIFLIDQNNKIFSLNTKDGSLVWDILSISSFIKSQNLLSLAVSKSGDLFAITSAADIYKIQGETGKVIWSRNAAGSLYVNATDFFNSSEIVLSEEQIIFSTGTSIFAYNNNTGSSNWKNDVSSIDAPIIDGKNIFIVTSNGYMVILDKKTGKIISSSNILNILKKKKQNTTVTNFIMGSDKIYSITLNGYMIVSSARSGKPEFYKKIGGSNISPVIINNGKLYVLIEGSKITGFK